MKELKEILSATPATFRLPLLMQTADDERESVFFDMADTGNIFICGPTGTGKSSLMHHMIASLIYAKSPSELKLAILDGNGTEHCEYIDLEKKFLIGHPLTGNVDIERPEEILDVIEWVSGEVYRRLKLIIDSNAKTVIEFNANNPTQQLPDIVVFIDNCHTLFKSDSNRFVKDLTDISRFGNIVGVHFVCITNALKNLNLLHFLHTISDTNILFHMPDSDILQLLSYGHDIANPKGAGYYNLASKNIIESPSLYIEEIDSDYHLL